MQRPTQSDAVALAQAKTALNTGDWFGVDVGKLNQVDYDRIVQLRRLQDETMAPKPVIESDRATLIAAATAVQTGDWTGINTHLLSQDDLERLGKRIYDSKLAEMQRKDPLVFGPTLTPLDMALAQQDAMRELQRRDAKDAQSVAAVKFNACVRYWQHVLKPTDEHLMEVAHSMMLRGSNIGSYSETVVFDVNVRLQFADDAVFDPTCDAKALARELRDRLHAPWVAQGAKFIEVEPVATESERERRMHVTVHH